MNADRLTPVHLTPKARALQVELKRLRAKVRTHGRVIMVMAVHHALLAAVVIWLLQR